MVHALSTFVFVLVFATSSTVNAFQQRQGIARQALSNRDLAAIESHKEKSCDQLNVLRKTKYWCNRRDDCRYMRINGRRKCADRLTCEQINDLANSKRWCEKKKQCEWSEGKCDTRSAKAPVSVCKDDPHWNSLPGYYTCAEYATPEENTFCYDDGACLPCSCSCKDAPKCNEALKSDTPKGCRSVCAGEDEYIVEHCTEIRGAVCKPRTICKSTEYESTEISFKGEPKYDRTCTPVTKCTADEYESKAKTATSDRECSKIPPCQGDEYFAFPGNEYGTSDRKCSKLLKCTGEQYELTAPSATSNRVCKDLTECYDATWYISRKATKTSDRVCKPTKCVDDPYFDSRSGYTCEHFAKLPEKKGRCYLEGSDDLNVCLRCQCACKDEKACDSHWERYNKILGLIKQHSWLADYTYPIGADKWI